MVCWVSILIYKADKLRLIPELSQVKRKNQYKLSTKSADFDIPAVATVISLSPLFVSSFHCLTQNNEVYNSFCPVIQSKISLNTEYTSFKDT